jgi:hypothetical protein
MIKVAWIGTLEHCMSLSIDFSTMADDAYRNICRYDVLLKADQPLGNYWLTSQVQYRNGSPSGA